eukprot:Plantae.Rhodophyta-Purpureofilum_apyrenoidigerum.ctg14508.p1 GENE.Plantae.Rhodophyta-Purpureofilum_apyrenoidigerum.ctg14508~~Plantae.Rhodophyta-Purpureofilum_apyrenoidigerum.ctg14508.p1  ORF type:complete len:391 (+),score=78.11 Plantae.Rhodophyta-Purpureofilum_apyrenoidigerum.ctg14508:169-1173(+)
MGADTGFVAPLGRPFGLGSVRLAAARAHPRRGMLSRVAIISKLIDGKKIAQTVREEVAEEVHRLEQKYGRKPGLAVVIVGTRKDSQTYVRNKQKACEAAGMQSFLYELPEDVSQGELERVVKELNGRDDVDGILVQLPLPDHINNEEVLDSIRLEKDVDGFHPLNIGRLCMNGREQPLFVPCTPKGCMELLKRCGVELQGKNAVVLGRSNIVGLPVSMLLMQKNATVTVCHSRTKDLEQKVREADIIVAAVGKPELVRGDWIKPGAVIIDVGINAVDDASSKKGYRLVGDVEFEAAKEKAAWITPVPGGVGPMTIAMLLRNTLEAAKRSVGEFV